MQSIGMFLDNLLRTKCHEQRGAQPDYNRIIQSTDKRQHCAGNQVQWRDNVYGCCNWQQFQESIDAPVADQAQDEFDAQDQVLEEAAVLVVDNVALVCQLDLSSLNQIIKSRADIKPSMAPPLIHRCWYIRESCPVDSSTKRSISAPER